jgi:hypothetical protein
MKPNERLAIIDDFIINTLELAVSECSLKNLEVTDDKLIVTYEYAGDAQPHLRLNEDLYNKQEKKYIKKKIKELTNNTVEVEWYSEEEE